MDTKFHETLKLATLLKEWVLLWVFFKLFKLYSWCQIWAKSYKIFFLTVATKSFYETSDKCTLKLRFLFESEFSSNRPDVFCEKDVENSQNSQENTCASVSFLIKMASVKNPKKDFSQENNSNNKTGQQFKAILCFCNFIQKFSKIRFHSAKKNFKKIILGPFGR